LLDTDLLIQSWGQLNKRSAPGIDGVTADDFKHRLSDNITRLSEDLRNKNFRVSDVKRVFIPKADGKQRPLGLSTLDDKLLQQGVSQILQTYFDNISGNKIFYVTVMAIDPIRVRIKQCKAYILIFNSKATVILSKQILKASSIIWIINGS